MFDLPEVARKTAIRRWLFTALSTCSCSSHSVTTNAKSVDRAGSWAGVGQRVVQSEFSGIERADDLHFALIEWWNFSQRGWRRTVNNPLSQPTELVVLDEESDREGFLLPLLCIIENAHLADRRVVLLRRQTLARAIHWADFRLVGQRQRHPETGNWNSFVTLTSRSAEHAGQKAGQAYVTNTNVTINYKLFLIGIIYLCGVQDRRDWE